VSTFYQVNKIVRQHISSLAINDMTKPKICLVSSIPLLFWSFYRPLLERLKLEGFEIHLCSSNEPELDYFEEQEIKVWPMSIIRSITPLSDIRTFFRLIRLFKLERFDVLHAHTPKAGLLAMTAALIAGLKVRIYTCHGLPLETETGWKRWILKICEKLSFKCASKTLVVSNSLLEKVRQYNIYQGNKSVVLLHGTACGVDLKRFTKSAELTKQAKQIRKKLNITSDTLIIGFVGRLVPDKGIGDLLDVYHDLHPSYKNIHLLVIGDYEPHRGILSQIQKNMLNDRDNVTHLNFTQHIEEYYSAMDILVLPTKREGFPYVLLESAAMELPVVATRVTGCVDAVIDGETGFLVPPNDLTELSIAIQKLINNLQLRQSFGKAGRARVEQYFNVDMLVEAHMKTYKTLMQYNK